MPCILKVKLTIKYDTPTKDRIEIIQNNLDSLLFLNSDPELQQKTLCFMNLQLHPENKDACEEYFYRFPENRTKYLTSQQYIDEIAITDDRLFCFALLQLSLHDHLKNVQIDKTISIHSSFPYVLFEYLQQKNFIRSF